MADNNAMASRDPGVSAAALRADRVRNPTEERVVCEIRRRIRTGQLAPGARLPSRRELQQVFGVSGVTVDRAVRRLKQDGFLRTRDRSGTFVAPSPPHLSRYGLVISQSFGARFLQALLAEGKQLEENSVSQFPIYFGVHGGEESEDYHRLLQDLSEQRLAGLIFLSNPAFIDDLPVVRGFPEIPKVAIVGKSGRRDITAIHPDSAAALDLALAHFRRTGRTRVAVMTISQVGVGWAEELRTRAVASGLEMRPAWTLGLDPAVASWHRHAPAVLFDGPEGERPNALLIADDNLVEHATYGLLDLGLRVPEDIEVVAHANFPLQPPTAVRVRWVGFEAGRILQTCLDVFERRRRGERVAATVDIEPRFE